MRPDREEYRLGQTTHGQPLKLIGERQSNGETTWSLRREALSQRDESATIHAIPSDVLHRIAEIAGQLGRRQ